MKKLTSWDVYYSLAMAIACALSYAISTELLGRFVDEPNQLLGGMWAVVATVFVFRESRENSLSAGVARLIATCVSFALCLIYLLLFSVTGIGLAVVIGLGTIAMMALGRQDDISTTAITTSVVLVVAAIDPEKALLQPLLRLLDTVVGIAIGMACKWSASYIFYRAAGEPVR